MTDLMPDDGGNHLRPKQTRVVSPSPRKPSKVYATANEAIVDLERRNGPRSAMWTYHDIDGNPIGVVVRWDLPDGAKDIRPVSLLGDHWVIGGMTIPRPLYELPELVDAERVCVTEGEKAADAARSIGLIATTSPHGADSASKCDWSPLAGRVVVLLPDNDDAGRKYVRNVASILEKLEPAPTVRIVALPGLPSGGDIVDFLDAHDAVEPETLRERIEDLVDEAEPDHVDAVQPERIVPETLSWRPFPVEVLPEPARSFVVAGSRAIGCDSSFVGLPLLSALASAIGNARKIQLKRGWTEPCILWTGVVAESGEKKSPAIELALRPLRKRQARAMREHAELMKEHRIDILRYERDLASWKKKGLGDPPEKPEEPTADRSWTDDATIESLAVLLQQNWRGLLMVRDELSGWFNFDRYVKNQGGDVAKWLEMFGGRPMVTDRKSGDKKTIYVQRAAMCVAGGIQPEVLRRCLVQQYHDNGLAARLLLAYPPRRVSGWTEADVSRQTEREIENVIDRLYDLEPTIGDDGEPEPVIVGLTPEGKRVWIDFCNRHAQRQVDLIGDVAAMQAKIMGYAARIGLVVHLIRQMMNDPTLERPDAVDAKSIEAGVVLATWFGNEGERIYSQWAESDDDRGHRELAEWIGRKGGAVTAREVQQGHRQFKTAENAEAALEKLTKANLGHWEDTPTSAKGGRPSRIFRLSTPSTSTKPLETRELRGCVDVDTVDVSETTDSPEPNNWGVVQ